MLNVETLDTTKILTELTYISSWKVFDGTRTNNEVNKAPFTLQAVRTAVRSFSLGGGTTPKVAQVIHTTGRWPLTGHVFNRQ